MRDYHEFENCFADELVCDLTPHIFYNFLVEDANYIIKEDKPSNLMCLRLSTTERDTDGTPKTKKITVFQNLPKNNDRPKFTKFVQYFLKSLGLDTSENLLKVYEKIPSLKGKTITAQVECNFYQGQVYYNLIEIKGGTL